MFLRRCMQSASSCCSVWLKVISGFSTVWVAFCNSPVSPQNRRLPATATHRIHLAAGSLPLPIPSVSSKFHLSWSLLLIKPTTSRWNPRMLARAVHHLPSLRSPSPPQTSLQLVNTIIPAVPQIEILILPRPGLSAISTHRTPENAERSEYRENPEQNIPRIRKSGEGPDP